MKGNRLLRAWLLAAACAVVLTGCKDDESDGAPSGPEIRFEVSGVDVGAEGGVQTLAYEIAGDEEPGTLEARVDETVGWVHSFDTSEAGVLRFEVDANDTEAERTAVVYVTWPGAEQVQLAVRQAPGEGGMSWVFDVQIENWEVTLNVTPSDDAQAYFADIQYYDVYEQMGLTPKEFAESVVADMIAFYGEAAGMTPEEVIAGMSIYGPASKPYGVIMPGTKYIAFAFALNEAGEVVSEVKIENFETPPADPSDNRISIRVDNVTARTTDVYYTTTNSDVYLYDVVPAAEIEGMTDEQAMTHIISNWGGYINYALTSGDHLYEAEYLEPGTDYVAVGFGYDVLTYTTALTKVAFHTDEPGDPAACEFGFRFESSGPGTVLVSVDPSDETVRYFWNLYDASASVDDIKALIEESIRTNTENGYYADVFEYWQNESSIGKDSYLFVGLDPDKTYRAAAVALDLKTGGFGGEFFLSDVYPEESAGELSIELVYDKYFDGDQAAELGGEYASFAGKALVPVSVRVNGAGSYRWAVTTYPEDYTSASDKSFWSTLSWEEIFYEDEPAANIALDWDVNYTLVAMVRNDAEDAYERFVQEVRFTKQGASPIGELTPSAQPAPLCAALPTGFRPLAAEGRAVDRSEAARRAEWKALARQTERQYPFGALPFGRIDARR